MGAMFANVHANQTLFMSLYNIKMDLIFVCLAGPPRYIYPSEAHVIVALIHSR